MNNETINLSEWVEAIRDVASLEKDLRETSNPHKQQILLKARQDAVERVLAIRYLTGATTNRVEEILNSEQWASTFYHDLSKETLDDMGHTDPQTGYDHRPAVEARDVPPWYGSASPISKTVKGS